MLFALFTPHDITALVAWSLFAIGCGLLLDYVLRPAVYDRELADQIAALRREREAPNHLHRYPSLLKTSEQLSQAQTEDEMAAVLAKNSHKILPRLGLVQVFTGTASQQRCRAEWHEDNHQLVAADSREITFVAEQARPLVHRQRERVTVAVPLRGDRRLGANTSHDERRGVLLTVFPTRGLEDHLILGLLDALSRLGGLAMASVDLIEEARDLALYDDLTGLFGRHEFLRRLNEAAAAVQREARAGCCDHDRHGPPQAFQRYVGSCEW